MMRGKIGARYGWDFKYIIIPSLRAVHHKEFKDTKTIFKKNRPLMAGNICYLCPQRKMCDIVIRAGTPRVEVCYASHHFLKIKPLDPCILQAADVPNRNS